MGLEKVMSRREFLRFLGWGAVDSAMMYAIFGGLAFIRQPEQHQKQEGSELLVADFNQEIFLAVDQRHTPGSSVGLLFPLAIGYGMAFFTEKQKEIKKRPALRIGLTATVLAAHGGDLYTTKVGMSSIEDPRFTEYRFNELVFETNPLQPKHPTPKTLARRGAITGTIVSIVTYFYPPMAGLYIPGGALLYKNNMSLDTALRECYTLGDQVKALIGQGGDRRAIAQYLQTYATREKGNS